MLRAHASRDNRANRCAYRMLFETGKWLRNEKVSGIISERDYVCKIALLGKASKDTTVRLTLMQTHRFCGYFRRSTTRSHRRSEESVERASNRWRAFHHEQTGCSGVFFLACFFLWFVSYLLVVFFFLTRLGEGDLHPGTQDGGGEAVGHDRGLRQEDDRRGRASPPRHRRRHRRGLRAHLGQGELFEPSLPTHKHITHTIDTVSVGHRCWRRPCRGSVVVCVSQPGQALRHSPLALLAGVFRVSDYGSCFLVLATSLTVLYLGCWFVDDVLGVVLAWQGWTGARGRKKCCLLP